ncbi:MAG: hypothetical protein ACR2KP_14165 [Egibacteraceae bacterium]
MIAVEPERIGEFDIAIPQLTRQLQRSPGGLSRLRPEDLPARRLSLPEVSGEESVEYVGRDLRSGEVVEQATYPLPRADDPDAVLAWFVHEIQRETRLTGQFAVLASLVKDYVEDRAFVRPWASKIPRCCTRSRSPQPRRRSSTCSGPRSTRSRS